MSDSLAERLRTDPEVSLVISEQFRLLDEVADGGTPDSVLREAHRRRVNGLLASRGLPEIGQERGEFVIDQFTEAPAATAYPQPNGHRPNGPRIPRKTEWFTLPDEFGETDPPMKCKIWVTYPRKLIDDIRSGEPDRQRPALRQIVLEHNGWIGEDGEPLPPADTDKFWDEVPDIVAGAVIAIVTVEVGKAAASVMRKQRR